MQALHWDRGRLARIEREARTALLQFNPLRGQRVPDGARCGRDARGPSEELESFITVLSKPGGAAERPIAWFCAETHFWTLVFDLGSWIGFYIKDDLGLTSKQRPKPKTKSQRPGRLKTNTIHEITRSSTKWTL